MPDSAQQLYELVVEHCRRTAVMSSISSLLSWDERTQLPPAAGQHRADQMTLLSGLIHERNTDPRLGDWLTQLAASPLAADKHSDAGTTIRQLKRNYDKAVRLPRSLVEELTRTAVLGQQAWEKARTQDDFDIFCPLLTRMVHLKRQEADALGYEHCRYDALLDEFEPGEKTANIRRVLSGLRDALVPLVAAIADSSRKAPVDILAREFPAARQSEFGRSTAARIGFDFQRGRLDTTAHPCCIEVGPHDTRLTTRYDERFFPSAFFGILHEAGHGLYEQGLRPDMWGLPPGQAISLGIHESQSRMWENLVGRSRPFWEHFFPAAQQAFPGPLGDVSLDDFYCAINDVRPSLIRVEADEVTYNLHILIRFELEQPLLDGDLPVEDLPAAWNNLYRQYLGIEAPSAADGVLQDIHWSFGAIGYFPTYTLGNLYAAQFFAAADRDIGPLGPQFAAGQFEPLLCWLREHIHRQGQCLGASELVERVTGQPLSHAPLVNYLQGRFGPLYELN
jgi:carboxypeptidase Taq